MKTFKEYTIEIQEMAFPTYEPVSTKDKDRQNEWSTIFSNKSQKRFIKLLDDNVKPQYKLYQYGSSFYLTEKDGSYVAHVDVQEKDVYYEARKKKAFIITHGNANVRGTYIILLVSILKNTKKDFIFSDKRLSDGAIKFYKKVLKGSMNPAYVLLGQEVQKPKEGADYFNNEYRIGIALDKYLLEEGYYELDHELKMSHTSWESQVARLYSLFYEDEF